MKTVTRRFNYKLHPTPGQKKILDRILNDITLTWNIILTKLIKKYGTDPSIDCKKFLTPDELTKFSKALRANHPYIKRVSSTAMQQILRHLGLAFKSYFANRTPKDENKYFPKFKSYKKPQSFNLTRTGFEIVDNKLKLAKHDNLFRVRWSRSLPSVPSSITVSKDTLGHYFVSFVCLVEVTRASGEGDIGIDVGTKYLGTISDGAVIENPDYMQKALPEIKKLNQKLHRTDPKTKEKTLTEGSREYNRIKLRLARIYEKIKNQREDFQHKLTNFLISKYQVITIEGLGIKKLLKKNKQIFNKTGNRRIADVAWGSFFLKLKYKMSETNIGRIFLADPHFPSTQLCSNCDKYPTKKLVLKDEIHNCEYCKQTMDRDLNASINLRKLGSRVITNSTFWMIVKEYSNVFGTPKYIDLKFHLGYPE